MAIAKKENLKKKSREDLLLIIRDLVEENQRLANELSGMQSEPSVEQDAQGAMLEKPDLLTGMDELRRSVDACAEFLQKLCNSKEVR